MATHDEDIKRVRIMPDIDALAAAGYEKIPKDDFVRLKFVGLYKQKQVPYFMIRIKVSGGRITLDQLAECSRIAMEISRVMAGISSGRANLKSMLAARLGREATRLGGSNLAMRLPHLETILPRHHHRL